MFPSPFASIDLTNKVNEIIKSGLPNRADSTMSKVDGSRTFTIAPTVASFSFYVSGVRFEKRSAQSIVWPDVEGIRFIYFDVNGELATSTSFPVSATTPRALLAILYWDAVNNHADIYYADERHGDQQSPSEHEWHHQTLGALFGSGLAPGNLTVDGDGDSNAHAQIGIAAGVIYDEDLRHAIIDGAPQDITPILAAPCLYRSGTVWRRKVADAYPFVYTGTGGYGGTRLPYNSEAGGNWGWTEITNNQFGLFHVFATNDIAHPIVTIQGQGDYTSIVAAREGAQTELLSLFTEGLPLAEMVAVASFILQTSTAGYANPTNSRIRSTGDGDFVDWRGGKLVPGAGSGASDHGSLTGLPDNDHPQYGLLAAAQAWAAAQSATRTGLTIGGGLLAWSASTAKNHLGFAITGAVLVKNPTGTLVPDTVYMLRVVCNGANSPTWEGFYDWADDGVPDLSAVGNAKVVWITMVADSASKLHCVAVGHPTGFTA